MENELDTMCVDGDEKSFVDSTFTGTEILINLFFRCIKLCIITFMCAFFIGIGWYIICNLYYDYYVSNNTDIPSFLIEFWFLEDTYSHS